MIYLLDTDTLVYLIRGLKIDSPRNERQKERSRTARRILARCRKQQASGAIVALSSITIAELEFGARHSGDYTREISAVRKILVPFAIYDFDAHACSEHYGDVRHHLENSGTTIGAMDLLIAGHAKALDATLVTNNLSHFTRVPGLICENWT
ncbi:MAG: PIN domain-containing protein [Planctomycetaceae bacterium]|nr:PIN domain-containing protein [Planctomycetaceae bacterium]